MTAGGVQITSDVTPIVFDAGSNKPGTSGAAIEDLIDELDGRRGVLLQSSYEFPGRYARWSLGFVDPPLEVSGRKVRERERERERERGISSPRPTCEGSRLRSVASSNVIETPHDAPVAPPFLPPPLPFHRALFAAQDKCTVRALNKRGMVIMPAVLKALRGLVDSGDVVGLEESRGGGAGGTGDEFEGMPDTVQATIAPTPPPGTFSEEERSRLPSLFSVVRSLVKEFGYASPDGQLGLYGAFGYDLTFQVRRRAWGATER